MTSLRATYLHLQTDVRTKITRRVRTGWRNFTWGSAGGYGSTDRGLRRGIEKSRRSVVSRNRLGHAQLPRAVNDTNLLLRDGRRSALVPPLLNLCEPRLRGRPPYPAIARPRPGPGPGPTDLYLRVADSKASRRPGVYSFIQHGDRASTQFKYRMAVFSCHPRTGTPAQTNTIMC